MIRYATMKPLVSYYAVCLDEPSEKIEDPAMTKYEANWYLVNHNIESFRCIVVKGITYFYIEK